MLFKIIKKGWKMNIIEKTINGNRVVATISRQDVLFSCEAISLSEEEAINIQREFGYDHRGYGFYSFEVSNKKSDYFFIDKFKIYSWKCYLRD